MNRRPEAGEMTSRRLFPLGPLLLAAVMANCRAAPDPDGSAEAESEQTRAARLNDIPDDLSHRFSPRS